MSEQGGYDPFNDDGKPKNVAESQVIHDPMEELLSGPEPFPEKDEARKLLGQLKLL